MVGFFWFGCWLGCVCCLIVWICCLGWIRYCLGCVCGVDNGWFGGVWVYIGWNWLGEVCGNFEVWFILRKVGVYL